MCSPWRHRTNSPNRSDDFRKYRLHVSAAGQSDPVAGPGAVGPQGVHDADQHRPMSVGADRDAVPGLGQPPVRVLHADGPQHRAGYWTVHIVQRRSVRTQAPGRADVRAERVLLRRVLFRHHRVRHHRQLEDDDDNHDLHADPEHGGRIAGKFRFVPVRISKMTRYNLSKRALETFTLNSSAIRFQHDS